MQKDWDEFNEYLQAFCLVGTGSLPGVKWPVKPTTHLYVMPEIKNVWRYTSIRRTFKGVAFN
jgi:hypothetical protein